jgi:hypothetical protein
MLIIGEFGSRVKAGRAREFLAADLGAAFDPLKDEYTWEREGERRILRLARGDAWELQVLFQAEEE